MKKAFFYFVIAMLFIQLPMPTSAFLYASNLIIIIICAYKFANYFFDAIGSYLSKIWNDKVELEYYRSKENSSN